MVGILLSYWGGLFSGATLVSGRVHILVEGVWGFFKKDQWDFDDGSLEDFGRCFGLFLYGFASHINRLNWDIQATGVGNPSDWMAKHNDDPMSHDMLVDDYSFTLEVGRLYFYTLGCTPSQ